jgi:gliding motility-associated-like protein
MAIKKKIHFIIYRKNILFSLFLLLSALLFSQKESAIWYFGTNAGIDFNQGALPQAITDGQINTREGCATISSAEGNLLFYTDGITVWDRNHDIMQNGTGLLGNSSSTQSAIIVPKPGSANIYYIFTVTRGGFANGLRYSEVDINQNNGNGAITQQKNILLITPSTEKISAIRHSNGIDYWVVAHSWRSNDFLSYSVTSDGVNLTPVISSVGSVHDGEPASAIGYLKLSPNGRRLALAKWTRDRFSDPFVEICDFNTSTGEVSNPITINDIFYKGIRRGPYGIEFSPNSRFLYVSDLNGNSNANTRVFQFDLNLSDPEDIKNEAVILYDDRDFIAGIQLGLDQKLYLANENSGYLDVINDPDKKGVDANYENRKLFLNGRNARMGLPPFIQSFFLLDFEFVNTCLGEQTSFSLKITSTINNVEWDFGDGTTSNEINPNHIYEDAGIYEVSVLVDFGSEIKTIRREIIIYETPTIQSVDNLIICSENQAINIFNLEEKVSEILGSQSSDIFEVTFYQNFSDAFNYENSINESYQTNNNNEEIFYRITNKENNECFAIDSFLLIVQENFVVPENYDFKFCDDELIDGLIDLNLLEIANFIKADLSLNDLNVSFYLSPQDAINEIASLGSSYQTSSNPQVIYSRVEDPLKGACFNIVPVSINVIDPVRAFKPNPYYLCDDESRDGIEEFNLSSLNNEIINNQIGEFTISFFNTEADAISNSSPIGPIYINELPSEILYARIENHQGLKCFDVISFEIGVLELPEVIEEETYSLCANSSVILNAEEGYDSYFWFNNESTESSIEVTEPGAYQVEISTTFSAYSDIKCSTIKTFYVEQIEFPILKDVDIKDWSDRRNSIEIITENGDHNQYSINNRDFQDSNFFDNLLPGRYEVKIKNICGSISETIYLLNYPKFFTPNGDGINDFWQIENSSVEPNMNIQIYDRYGKLIIQFDALSKGWDGTFNGLTLPSSDYWFRIIRPNLGIIYKGHFTLKR